MKVFQIKDNNLDPDAQSKGQTNAKSKFEKEADDLDL